MIEPTIEELSQAWNDCINLNCKLGSLKTLEEIRAQKFTWLGSYENKFRISVDKYISAKGTQND